MIKPRGSICFAIGRIIEVVGHVELCERLSVSKSELYRWSDPDEAKLPRLHHALEMDALAKEHGLGTPISDALCEALRNAPALGLPPDLAQVVAHAFSAASAGAEAYVAAKKRPSGATLMDARRKITEARDTYTALLRDIEALLPGAEPLRMVGEGRRG